MKKYGWMDGWIGGNGWIATIDPRRLGAIIDVLLFFGLWRSRDDTISVVVTVHSTAAAEFSRVESLRQILSMRYIRICQLSSATDLELQLAEKVQSPSILQPNCKAPSMTRGILLVHDTIMKYVITWSIIFSFFVNENNGAGNGLKKLFQQTFGINSR